MLRFFLVASLVTVTAGCGSAKEVRYLQIAEEVRVEEDRLRTMFAKHDILDDETDTHMQSPFVERMKKHNAVIRSCLDTGQDINETSLMMDNFTEKMKADTDFLAQEGAKRAAPFI